MNATLSPTLKTRLGFNPIFLVKMAAIHGLVTNPDPMSPVRNKWREAAILAGKTARGTDRKTKRRPGLAGLHGPEYQREYQRLLRAGKL